MDRKDYVNEKFSKTVGNRTRDLPVCSAVPQPTALPRGPLKVSGFIYKLFTQFN
jgi:hypothetical protein